MIFHLLYSTLISIPSQVMKTLVHFGAPKSILVNGKPHLGTDRLVPLLRNFRQHLQQLGVSQFFFFLLSFAHVFMKSIALGHYLLAHHYFRGCC